MEGNRVETFFAWFCSFDDDDDVNGFLDKDGDEISKPCFFSCSFWTLNLLGVRAR